MSTETWDSAALTSRSGHPKEIATTVGRHAVSVPFARRHPVITYVLTPIPVLLALWIAYILGLVGMANAFDAYKDRAWAAQVAAILVHGIAYVPAVALTLALAWLAIRSQTRILWWLAGATLVAIAAGMMMVSVSMPTTPGTGQLHVGLGFPPALSHWPQFLIPLALTALCVVWQISTAKGRPCSAE